MSNASKNAQSWKRLDDLKTINGESLHGPGNIVISGGGTIPNHNELDGRSAANAHPIDSITGLTNALNGKEDSGTAEGLITEYVDSQELLKSIETKATLIADFVRNQHRVYEQYGLTDKAITDVLDTTRASTATYDSPFGVATAAVNEPRITYDPETGACLGL